MIRFKAVVTGLLVFSLGLILSCIVVGASVEYIGGQCANNNCSVCTGAVLHEWDCRHEYGVTKRCAVGKGEPGAYGWSCKHKDTPGSWAFCWTSGGLAGSCKTDGWLCDCAGNPGPTALDLSCSMGVNCECSTLNPADYTDRNTHAAVTCKNAVD
jgi:hypothetical protein